MARPKVCSACGAELRLRPHRCPLCGAEIEAKGKAEADATLATIDNYHSDVRALRAKLKKLRGEAEAV